MSRSDVAPRCHQLRSDEEDVLSLRNSTGGDCDVVFSGLVAEHVDTENVTSSVSLTVIEPKYCTNGHLAVNTEQNT